MPSLTPQTTAPRCLTAASVCPAPEVCPMQGPAPSASMASANAAPRHEPHWTMVILASRYISGVWRTTTLVPTGTRSNRSTTSGLTRRKQPDDTDWPMVWGWLVP